MGRKLLSAALICFILILSVGCSTAQQPKKLPADKVVTADEATPNQTIDAFGVIKANETRDINISFPTFVEEIHVKEGQRVKKGDILLTLNMVEFQESIKSQELNLDLKRRLLDVDKKNVSKGTDPEFNRLTNDLKNAESLYNKDLADLANREILFNNGAISQVELDDFIKAVDLKKKAVEDAKFAIQDYKLSKSNEFDRSETEISILASDIKIMKEKQNRTYLNDNTIVCDVDDGLVLNLKPLVGHIVTQEEPETLFNIVDLNSLIVLADVDESFIKDVKLGARVTIIPLADRSKRYTGNVNRITEKAIVKNGQTFIQVEIVIDDNNGFLQLDYNVDVEIEKE